MVATRIIRELWRRGRGPMMLGAVVGLLGLGCSLFSGPPETIVYDLTRIAGRPLPAPADEGVDTQGNRFAFIVLSASLTLFGDKTYLLEGTGQRTENGVPIEPPQHTERTGPSYKWTEKELILKVGNPNGDLIIYQIFEGGRILRGASFGGVYEFVRRDSPA